MFHDYNRQTGRTTRMLKEAIDAALNGKNVFVIAHNSHFAKQLSTMAEQVVEKDYKYSGALIPSVIHNPAELSIHKRGAGTIRFRGVQQNVTCLETYPYCVRGHKEECFVDHVVWEQYGWRPSHATRKEPSHPWDPGEDWYKWFEDFNETFTPVVETVWEADVFANCKKVADNMAKKPYISTACLDMRDKFGGGKI